MATRNLLARIVSPVLIVVVVMLGTFGFASASSATPATSTKQVNVACKGWGGIASYKAYVNGTQVSSLDEATVPGNATVTVKFTVTKECAGTVYGLALYQAPTGEWDATQAYKQVLLANKSQSVRALKAGKEYTLSVKTLDCYFQVDFFTGAPIAKLNGTSKPPMTYTATGNYIDSATGGKVLCVEVEQTTTTRKPTTTTQNCNETTTTAAPVTTTTVAPNATTTTAKPTTTTTEPETQPTVVQQTTTTTAAPVTTTTVAPNATTTTTRAPEVEPTVVIKPTTTVAAQATTSTTKAPSVNVADSNSSRTTTTAAPQVKDTTLARTGFDATTLAFLGLALVALGVGLARVSSRLNKAQS